MRKMSDEEARRKLAWRYLLLYNLDTIIANAAEKKGRPGQDNLFHEPPILKTPPLSWRPFSGS